MLIRNDRPPSTWDTHGISGNVFCRSSCVFYSTLSARVQSMDFSLFGQWRAEKQLLCDFNRGCQLKWVKIYFICCDTHCSLTRYGQSGVFFITFSTRAFAGPVVSSTAPYPQELNPWSSSTEEPLHTSTAEKSERPEQNRDLRCQSGPSAKSSVIPSGGHSSKNCGADQHWLQISDLQFDKFPTPATFACWKIRFKTEVCTCSQFPTEAMLWIKEVEMVDSVDDLKSSSSIRGIQMPKFEVLDAKIASALNRIIHNSHSQKKNQSGGTKGPEAGPFPSRNRLLTWSTSTSGSLEPMNLSRIMRTYLQLFFEMMISRNSIRNGTKFYCQWRKSHLMISWKACTN